MLVCSMKKCVANNFPLKLVANDVETEESEYNRDFIVRFIAKIDWPALVVASSAVRTYFFHYNLVVVDTPVSKN
jgi:hypothetical protein